MTEARTPARFTENKDLVYSSPSHVRVSVLGSSASDQGAVSLGLRVAL